MLTLVFRAEEKRVCAKREERNDWALSRRARSIRKGAKKKKKKREKGWKIISFRRSWGRVRLCRVKRRYILVDRRLFPGEKNMPSTTDDNVCPSLSRRLITPSSLFFSSLPYPLPARGPFVYLDSVGAAIFSRVTRTIAEEREQNPVIPKENKIATSYIITALLLYEVSLFIGFALFYSRLFRSARFIESIPRNLILSKTIFMIRL